MTEVSKKKKKERAMKRQSTFTEQAMRRAENIITTGEINRTRSSGRQNLIQNSIA